jgi:MFS family permease
MQAGAALLALGGAAYLLPIGLPGLIADRLLLGVGEAALFTAGAGWTVSLSPRERRGQLIGLYGVSMWGGISLGTALGAVLVHDGYPAVWVFSLAAPLSAVALLALVPAPAPSTTAPRRIALLLRPTALPGTALALGSAGYAGLAAFIVLHLQARGIPAGVAVLSCFSAVYAGSRLVIGRLPDRYGPRPVATACGIAEAAGLIIIAVAPNLAVALLGSIALGAGFSLLHPSLALMVMNRTDPARQGAALGAYTSFWDLGLAVWGPLTGAVATGFGYPAVFVAAAIAAIGAAGLAQVAGRARVGADR